MNTNRHRIAIIVFLTIDFLATVFNPASAQVPVPSTSPADFSIVKYNNPGTLVDLGVGLWGWPIPIDYDKDGDLDMLVSSQGKPFNGVYFFENKSGTTNSVFEKPVRLSNSIKDVQVSYIKGLPRVLIPGAELMNFTGDLAANKRKLYPVDSILKDFSKKPRFNQWKLVDYDNDGDEDIVVAVDDWTDYGTDVSFDTAGNWTRGPLHGYIYKIENKEGAYINTGRIQVDGKDLDVYGVASPNFEDFDGDGDLDLICGEFLDKLNWFENVGTREKPEYARPRFLENGNGVIKMDLEMIVPVAVDWNKDGFIDLIIGDEDGRVALVENTGKVKNKMPVFKSPVYFKQKADNLKFGALVTPFNVDWNNDGREDIVCGNSAGYLSFIKNLGGNKGTPVWASPELLKSNGKIIRIQAGPSGSIQGPAEAKWGYTTLSVADWDGDGLKDVIVSSIWGEVTWYKNTGKASSPKLGECERVKVDWGNQQPVKPMKPKWNWWQPKQNSLVTQWRTSPYAIDWNKDGLMDLVMLDQEGYLSFFERFRQGSALLLKPGKRIFYSDNASGFNHRHEITDSLPGSIRLNTGNLGPSGRRKFCFADWDGDGDMDLLVNSINVTVMINTGTKDGIVHFTNSSTLSNVILAGHDTSPTTVDWNKDGIPDLVAGAEDGHFYYYENPRKK
jgi:hypothetical protein